VEKGQWPPSVHWAAKCAIWATALISSPVAGPMGRWFLSPAFLEPLGWAITGGTLILAACDARALWRLYHGPRRGSPAILWLRFYTSWIALGTSLGLFIAGPATFVPGANGAAVLLFVLLELDLADLLVWIMTQPSPSCRQASP
jgi:hypothetical protein